MYKIGIIGHSPEHFSFCEETIKNIEDVIGLLSFQYGQDNNSVIFNILGEIGTGIWAAKYIRDSAVSKYHMFLPYSQEIVSKDWYDEQKVELTELYNKAYSITICNQPWAYALKNLVDDSNFVVCFWTGKKQGNTFHAIEYALKSNKMVLHGLNGLKLITNDDIKKSTKRK